MILTTLKPDKSTDTPTPDKSTSTQKPAPAKNDREKKPAEQEDKKDTLVPIKNDKNENAFAPPITDKEEIVSIKPKDQVESSTRETEIIETSEENITSTVANESKFRR